MHSVKSFPQSMVIFVHAERMTGNFCYADLQHETLLWVHDESLRGMDAKAGSIKVLHTIHKPAKKPSSSNRSHCRQSSSVFVQQSKQ